LKCRTKHHQDGSQFTGETNAETVKNESAPDKHQEDTFKKLYAPV
jgi:hypothetical protein